MNCIYQGELQETGSQHGKEAIWAANRRLHHSTACPGTGHVGTRFVFYVFIVFVYFVYKKVGMDVEIRGHLQELILLPCVFCVLNSGCEFW